MYRVCSHVIVPVGMLPQGLPDIKAPMMFRSSTTFPILSHNNFCHALLYASSMADAGDELYTIADSLVDGLHKVAAPSVYLLKTGYKWYNANTAVACLQRGHFSLKSGIGTLFLEQKLIPRQELKELLDQFERASTVEDSLTAKLDTNEKYPWRVRIWKNFKLRDIGAEFEAVAREFFDDVERTSTAAKKQNISQNLVSFDLARASCRENDKDLLSEKNLREFVAFFKKILETYDDNAIPSDPFRDRNTADSTAAEARAVNDTSVMLEVDITAQVNPDDANI
ncbi:unnamed protein product [Somion occarium]|uniref:Uncharacterized protein n=1 Tax=Somion occarium TaxID=3059160 RepID=A0ABP1DEN7_9APHY